MSTTKQPTKAEAIKSTTRWREFYDKVLSAFQKGRIPNPNGEDIFRGFRIPIQDLQGLLAVAGMIDGVEYVRAYLAQKDDGIMDLVIVPVAAPDTNNPNGADILEMEIIVNGVLQVKSTIYDFTSPCPDACSNISPLYRSATQE